MRKHTPKKHLFGASNFFLFLGEKGLMKFVLIFLIFLVPSSASAFKLQTQSAPAGPLIKHLTSIVKWSRSSSKPPHQSDANVLQFEEGYLVETIVEGKELGFISHSIRVLLDGDLFAVDADNSNIVRITPPLSQYSRARLVAGSFQGYTGHVDGKPIDARFNHPKGVTVDDKGNVYVADTSNFAIRKIGEAGVTTIAGGKSNVAGYRDGASEDAQFSNDFDVIYVRTTCSLLVIDRGNAALRQISLSKEDCDYENSSVSPTDLLMVAGAILIGYASCILQQRLGSSFSNKMKVHPGLTKLDDQSPIKTTPTPIGMTVKDEPVVGWPSFGQLVWDLGKLSLESLGGIFFQFVPLQNFPKRGLTPLKDSLIMPEDESRPPSSLKQRAPTPLSEAQSRPPSSLKQRVPTPLSEARQAHFPSPGDQFSEVKPIKIRPSTPKDPTLPTKHRSSRRQEFAEFYGPSESSQYGQVRSKSQKERTKHRQREKSVDTGFGGSVMEAKGSEVKGTGFENTKYNSYSFRNKYGDAYRYD